MDYTIFHKELMLPSVRIVAEKAGGSGTVLYSAPNAIGTYSTYILTNHHVVEGNLKIEKRWSALLRREVKTDVASTVHAHFFDYIWDSRAIGGRSVQADIVAYDKDEDLALLKTRTETPAPAVARLYPCGKEKDLRVGMQVLTVGAGMGEPPVITSGMLSQFGREIDNREFWLNTAPSIFGNSGGAMFLADTHELLGVPARISVFFSFAGMQAVTHLSYAIPITRIYKFLEDQLFRFIYDSAYTEEGEEREREKRRENEEYRIAHEEEQGQQPDEENME